MGNNYITAATIGYDVRVLTSQKAIYENVLKESVEIMGNF